MDCHPERSEGSGLLPAVAPAPANTEIPRFARDDRRWEESLASNGHSCSYLPLTPSSNPNLAARNFLNRRRVGRQLFWQSQPVIPRALQPNAQWMEFAPIRID